MQDWKVSFWGSARDKVSVNIKMKDFVGNQGCGSGYFVNRFRFRFQQSLDSDQSLAWTLTEPGLYLIYELADKHDYQNQQLTIYKGTLLVEMIA